MEKFLETPYAKKHVTDWCEKLQNSQNLSEDQNDGDSCYSEQLPEREEWMHLAEIVPGSFINTAKEIPHLINIIMTGMVTGTNMQIALSEKFLPGLN